jgi:hypothetical protein
MKHIVFLVDAAKSYYKEFNHGYTKHSVPLPFVVSLLPGGTISLEIDEKNNKATGDIKDVKFVTDQFEKQNLGSGNTSITGYFQTFDFLTSDVSLSFDSKTGEIVDMGGWFHGIMPEPVYGGQGNAFIGAKCIAGPSFFIDSKKPFSFADGLGCGGGITIDFQPNANPDTLGPYNFIHIEGIVSLEDVDGDGNFERACKIKPPELPRPRRSPPFPHEDYKKRPRVIERLPPKRVPTKKLPIR